MCAAPFNLCTGFQASSEAIRTFPFRREVVTPVAREEAVFRRKHPPDVFFAVRSARYRVQHVRRKKGEFLFHGIFGIVAAELMGASITSSTVSGKRGSSTRFRTHHATAACSVVEGTSPLRRRSALQGLQPPPRSAHIPPSRSKEEERRSAGVPLQAFRRSCPSGLSAAPLPLPGISAARMVATVSNATVRARDGEALPAAVVVPVSAGACVRWLSARLCNRKALRK